MARINDFGMVSVENAQYTTVAAGEFVAGTVRATMGTAPCRLVWFRAAATNSGTVYVGGTGVTAESGTANATTGWALGAGNGFGPLPVADVSALSVIASAASQRGQWFSVS